VFVDPVKSFDKGDLVRYTQAVVPIPGVTVRLFQADVNGMPSGVVVATAVTDAAGLYLFQDVRPGVYAVVEEQPGGYRSVGSRAGHVPPGTAVVGVGSLDVVIPGAYDPDEDSVHSIVVGSGKSSIENDFGERVATPNAVFTGGVGLPLGILGVLMACAVAMLVWIQYRPVRVRVRAAK
jgi:hypothetical protein